MEISEIKALFSKSRYHIKRTSSGVEIVLEKCPMDLHKLGERHPAYKVYVNPSKETLKCFVCHKPGEGLSLVGFGRHLRRLTTRIIDDKEAVPEQILPPLPPSMNLCDLGMMHPGPSYLAERGVSVPTAAERGIRWKPTGIPAWVKINDQGKKVVVGTFPGLIIPIYTRTHLDGFQFASVPRIKSVPKYITAPGSKIAGALFNFDRVVSGGLCVVVEGVFDALKMPEAAVAILSDNLGSRKIRLLSSAGFKKIVLMLDGDRTEEHLMREYAKLQRICSDVKLIRLPDGKDPGECSSGFLKDQIYG